MPKKRKSIGCFTRILLILVIALLIFRYGWITWGWWLFSIGVLFYIAGLKKGGNLEYLFPGTILLVFSVALLLRQYDLVNLPLWRIWSVLFGAMGLSFLLMWLVRNSSIWVFIPGGLLLLASGGGFSSRSFVRYQIWLRGIVDWWPLLLALIVVFIVVYYWRVRSEQ